MPHNVHTVTDLMAAAAKALTERDADALDKLRRKVCDWMQTEEETAAQLAMLDAMSEAAYELHELGM